MKRINKLNAVKVWCDHKRDEWGYCEGYAIETADGARFGIHTDKPARACTVGAIPVKFKNGVTNEDGYKLTAWCFDKRIVAMVADMWKRAGEGEIQYPDKGDEIHLPTDEEAAAIFGKYGIPQDENGAENLYAECEPIDENGNPVED